MDELKSNTARLMDRPGAPNSASRPGVDPILQLAIQKLPIRRRLSLVLVLWPPLSQLLDDAVALVRRDCADARPEDLIARSLIAALRAADKVGKYTEPAWPMRVVEAFVDAFLLCFNSNASASHEFHIVVHPISGLPNSNASAIDTRSCPNNVTYL